MELETYHRHVRDAAHEIRNNLATILTSARTLSRPNLPEELRNEVFDMIEKQIKLASEHLTRLVAIEEDPS